jgi:hypothetical protein
MGFQVGKLLRDLGREIRLKTALLHDLFSDGLQVEMRGIGVVHELPVENEMASGYHGRTKVEFAAIRLWKSAEKNGDLAILACCKRGSFWENPVRTAAPPSPTPSESLDWRGVYKNGLQNLEPLGVRGKNLDNKQLAAFFALDACTISP